jgi:esterase
MAVELHGEVYGSGAQTKRTPIVILHGLFGSSTNWRALAKQLACDRTVHVLDLRNHGVSPHHDEMNYGLMADDVKHFLATSQLSCAVVIGHSMGGKTAMQLALRDSSLVTRLIVVDIAPVRRERSFDTLLDAMEALQLSNTARRSDLDRELAKTIPDAPVRSFLLQNLIRVEGGFRWRINLQAIRENLSALLDFRIDLKTWRYLGPTLFVLGEKSDYVLPEHHTTIHTLFPDVRLTTIADAGHWVHAEQPQQFVQQIQQFLRD